MRIKLQASAPLPELRVLVSIPSSASLVEHIKAHVLGVLRPQLTAELARLPSKSYALSIDGFELIDGDEVGVIKEDADVVRIALRPSSSAATERSSKRQRTRSSSSEDVKPKLSSAPAPQPAAGQVKRQLSSSASSASSSSDSDPDTASNSSDASSSSAASSTSDSSDSESDSSSSSSSPASSATAKRKAAAASSGGGTTSKKPAVATASQARQPAFPVELQPRLTAGTPPGHGLASTRSRNARRRAARQALKVQQKRVQIGRAGPPAAAVARTTYSSESGSHAAPAASTDTASTPTQRVPGTDAAANQRVTQSILSLVGPGGSGMANRNKKKGFLKEMEGIRPVKIIFGEESLSCPQADPKSTSRLPVEPATGPTREAEPVQAADTALPFTTVAPADSEADRKRQLAALGGVTPSTIPKELLPSNVVVTSVSLPWQFSSRRKDGKRKRKEDAAGQPPHAGGQLSGAGADGDAGEEDLVDAAVPELELSDSKEEAVVPGAPSWQPAAVGLPDTTEIERKWDQYSRITPQWFDKMPLMLIGVGSRVAIKSLELNAETFSPELQTKVGQIIKMPDATDAIVHVRYSSNAPWADEMPQEEVVEAQDLGERELSKAERRRLMREALLEEVEENEVVQIHVAEFGSADYRLVT